MEAGLDPAGAKNQGLHIESLTNQNRKVGFTYFTGSK